MNSRWYVAKTHANKEREAEWHLNNQGFDYFLPLIDRTVKYRRSLMETQTPVFPGYIFIQFDRSENGWQAINGTRGVQRLLPKHLEKPTPLPIGIVEWIQRRHSQGELADLGPPDYQAGSHLDILQGPFQGQSGECVSTGVHRIRMLLDILGGKVEISVPVAHVTLALA